MEETLLGEGEGRGAEVMGGRSGIKGEIGRKGEASNGEAFPQIRAGQS